MFELRSGWAKAGLSVLAVGIAVLIVAPVVWVGALSLKTGREVYNQKFLPDEWVPGNYIEAWREFGLGGYFVNSAFVTAVSVVLTILVALLAAHAFTWLRFPGSDAVFTLLLLGIMIPPAALVLPLLVEARHLGLYNDLFGLSLVYVAFGLPISILIFRGFFAGIPSELVESARLDGAREWKILFRVIVPVARPAVVTVTILLFLANWNDFILALVLLRDSESYTLPVGISQFIGQYATPHELIAAASLIGSVPVFILYLVLERKFQQGVTAGALKG